MAGPRLKMHLFPIEHGDIPAMLNIPQINHPGDQFVHPKLSSPQFHHQSKEKFSFICSTTAVQATAGPSATQDLIPKVLRVVFGCMFFLDVTARYGHFWGLCGEYMGIVWELPSYHREYDRLLPEESLSESHKGG